MISAAAPGAAPHRRRFPGTPRTRRVIAIAIALLVVILVLFWPQAFNLHFQPNPTNAWRLFLVSALSFLCTVVLALVLARQIVKLGAERRANILGSRFKTKLVIGALALSLTPVICMFGFTYGLINRTLDKWFSRPVETVRDDNGRTLALLTRFVSDNANSEAISLAHSPALTAALAHNDWATVAATLTQHHITLQGGFAAILDPHGTVLASYQTPPGFHPSARAPAIPVGIAGTGFMLANAPAAWGDSVEIGMPVPAAITRQITLLAHDRDRYEQLAQDRKSLRLIYTSYLALLTLAVLFGATWMALYLSRQVTDPMGALATATQEIARGNLAYRVSSPAARSKDEIGLLVNSFNRMAADLEASRRYTATLLDHTPSAVISLDRSYSIEHVNPAVERLLGTRVTPRRLDDVFDAPSVRTLHHLLRKAARWPAASGQLEVATHSGRQLTLSATVAAIPSRGYVLVLEDLTDLLRIQKTAAWREVAQRIAHEIKNPLTPIALSAQRIQRRLAGRATVADADVAVVAECATTIETEARSLQRLVDEFSTFARFPHAQPVDCDLNDIIQRALRSFDGRLEGIEIRSLLEQPLPKLRLDPEDMKRVFLNLIDNAAEAMRQSPYRQLTLATQHLDGAIEAVVADTGHGLPAGDKQRIFLPYYSTRERGSGLGLAIVQRIVEENGGSLRAEDNEPLGARFILELPLPQPPQPVTCNL